MRIGSRGVTDKEVWEYIIRTLTNLPDERAAKIDNLDKAISTIAADVWNYASRSLTRNFTVLERARGYVSSPSVLIRERRAIAPKTQIVAYASQLANVGVFGEEKVHVATKTTNIPSGWSVTNNGAEMDADDNTYLTVTMPPSSSRANVFRYDLGQVFSGLFIMIRGSTGTTAATIYVKVSSDGVNYTDIITISGSTVVWVFSSVSNVRYIALDFSNSDPSYNVYAQIYTLEAYIPTTVKTFTNLTSDLLTVAVNGYYQVLEVLEV